MITTGLMSSLTPEWATPQPLFDSLSREFGPFDVDVCANAGNAKVARFYSKEDDGLSQEWTGRCWMNPPYGREIGRWVAKARRSAESGAVVVCLLPARTDTTWWHDNVIPNAAIVRFLRGRVRFNDSGPAPFPSAVVVFGVAHGCDRDHGDLFKRGVLRCNTCGLSPALPANRAEAKP